MAGSGESSPSGSLTASAAATAVPDDLVVLHARWPSMRPFVVMGGTCVIAGGLVAAVSRPTEFELGSWVAAYLVLVGGVAQVSLGVGRAWLAWDAARPRRTLAEAALWNVGLAGTLVGSLRPAFGATAVGGAFTAAALVSFLLGIRRTRPGQPVLSVVYRGLVGLIIMSTPVGVALAWARHA
jgi:hypothetical protein